jgi:outer membrane receptor protein involved in Fe transport
VIATLGRLASPQAILPRPFGAIICLLVMTFTLYARAGEEEEAEEIVITADRIEKEDVTSDAQAIEGEELRQSPRSSLLEAVAQEVPAVYVQSRGVGLHGIASGASGGISIRGLGGSPNTQILVVQDGIPDYQGVFGHPLPDAYVPDLIEEVRVIAGGDSVLFGTNALGGVIELKSRWRTRPGAEIRFRAGYGSYQSLVVQPAFLGRFGNWNLAASFHGKSSAGHRPGAGGDLQVGQAGARVWLGERSRLTLRLKIIHIHGADPGPVTHPYRDHWFDALRLNASSLLEYFQNGMEWRAAAYASMGRHALYDGFLGLDLVAGAYLENCLKIDEKLNLLLGASFDHVDGRVENRIEREDEPVEGLSNLAVYQQATWRPLDFLTLVAGTREVFSFDYGFLFLYKAGAGVAAWPGGTLRARYTANFRQPTIRERYLPYPVSNPDLKPETSRNLDAGVLQRLDDWLQVQLTFFVTEADNFIKYFGSWPTATVVNIDHVVFPGVEGRLRVEKLGPLELAFGGAWMEVGRYTRQNPAFKLDGRIGFAWRDFKATLSGEWVTGLYQNNYSRDPLDDVFFLDLDLRYTLERLGLAFFLVARNLIDNRYAYIDRYPMPGFHLFAGLEVSL